MVWGRWHKGRVALSWLLSLVRSPPLVHSLFCKTPRGPDQTCNLKVYLVVGCACAWARNPWPATSLSVSKRDVSRVVVVGFVFRRVAHPSNVRLQVPPQSVRRPVRCDPSQVELCPPKVAPGKENSPQGKLARWAVLGLLVIFVCRLSLRSRLAQAQADPGSEHLQRQQRSADE